MFVAHKVYWAISTERSLQTAHDSCFNSKEFVLRLVCLYQWDMHILVHLKFFFVIVKVNLIQTCNKKNLIFTNDELQFANRIYRNKT